MPALLSPPGELSLDSLFSDSPVVEPSPLALVPVFDAVVVVEVVCTAAFSALVFVGGVMSGALLGTASETLLLPHAPRLTASSAAQAVSAIRAVKAAPCAARRWDSR